MGASTAYIGVVGLRCPDCAERVRAAIASRKGVVAVDVRFESALAVIAYDPGVVGVTDLVDAVHLASRATGHRVLGVPVHPRFAVG